MANTLTKFQMLNKVWRVQQALAKQDLEALALALDMTPEIIEPMGLQELTDCLAVRLWDFTQEMENYL